MALHQATVSAPVNIAVIKYWGKRDTSLILPTNSSLSVTLDQDHLRSVTTARADPSFEDGARLWLNGEEEEIKQGGRLARCLDEMRKLRRELEASKPAAPKLSEMGVRICSENNFPTAAGLASSASGFAALVSALGVLYELYDPSSASTAAASSLSRIARQGSGSACRSLLGGFVAWEMGSASDGSDSLAVQIEPQSHWPSLHALICVVSDAKKGTPSTAGMQRTVATSALLRHRIDKVVPERMRDISSAISRKDFDTFAKITMADSNQFHAVCLDTEPPIFYMNDVSRAIISLITELNRASVEEGKGYRAAYTYDAGPNAVLYAEEKDMKLITSLIRRYFPNASFDDPFRLFKAPAEADNGLAGLPNGFNPNVIPVFAEGSVRRLIHTKVGDGPRIVARGESDEALLGADGMPKRLKA